MENKQQELQIEITAGAKIPVYANAMRVSHNKEEFVLEFMKIIPPTATLDARIVTSPGHLKRIIKALQENLERYENTFGAIKEADAPANEIGFAK
jgi:hypothetical protein